MSLSAILEAIADAGETRVRAIEADTMQRIETILSASRAEGESVCQQVRRERVAEAADECARIMQQARLSALRILGSERETLVEQALRATQQSLQKLRQTPLYPSVLRSLVTEALATLGASQPSGEGARLVADPRDHDLLQAILDEMKLKTPVGYELACDGGVIAQSEDGRIRVINTLEARLERALPYLRWHWGTLLEHHDAVDAAPS